MSAVRTSLLLLLLACVVTPAAQAADIFAIGSEARLTRVGVDGASATDATDPAVAYNSVDNEFLVAWVGPSPNGDIEIQGQILDGNGNPKGAAQPLTETAVSPSQPVLSYSPRTNQYVVGYVSRPPTPGSPNNPVGQLEVFARAVTANGVGILTPLRISNTDPDTGTAPDLVDDDHASAPALEYDTVRNQFRFVWIADHTVESRFEVRMQRVSGDLDTILGEDTVSDETTAPDAAAPALAHFRSPDRWIVVWEESIPLNGTEIVAQRVASGSRVGNESVISASAGANSSREPSVAAHPGRAEALVSFTGHVAGEGPEIFVQRVNANGDQVPGPADQRISTMGPDANPAFGVSTGRDTTTTYHPLLDRYLVTWAGSDDLPGLRSDEIERYAQALKPDGAHDERDDFRLSTSGGDGNDDAASESAATVALPGRRAWFSVWQADDNRTPLADGEYEIYGRFVGDDGDLDGHISPDDCNDNNAGVHPGAFDVPDNGVDEDCTGTFAENPDRDADGSPRPADCNDGNAGIRPGAADAPDNGVDEDCSGADAVNLDRDGDGAARPGDCNDGNPGIRPGAKDAPRNGVDEDCAGGDASFPNLTSGILPTWDIDGSRLKLVNLQITQQFPKGLKVKITCKGPRCPFKSKALKLGKVRRNAASAISSLTSKQRRFRAGQTLEVWVSAPEFNSRISRLALKARKIPVSQPFCALPGSTKAQKRCT